jgi:hypothetical protein
LYMLALIDRVNLPTIQIAGKSLVRCSLLRTTEN